MKKSIYLSLLAPVALGSCTTVVREPAPVVHQDVVTTPAVTHEIIVTRTPPPMRVETQTVSPGPRYVWTRGYWRWTGADFTWTPGHWVQRPRTTAVWVEGQWVRRPRGWVWTEGRWQ